LVLVATFTVCGGVSFAWASEAVISSNAAPNGLQLSGSLRQPAVSQVNGKLSYSGGSMDSEEGHNFEGSVSIPVSEQFGFQADGLFSHIGGEDFFGGAGHFFWRDPAKGLIGFSGGAVRRSDVEAFQAGAEAEWYRGSFTVRAFAGVGGISYDNTVPFIDTSPTDFIGRIGLDWYAIDDLRLGVSAMTAFANELYRAEIEYQTPINGLALTAEAAMGSHDYDQCLFGLRWYFGAPKSLRDRQRSDDPPSLMPQIMQGLGLYGAEFSSAGRQYLAARPELANWNVTSAFGMIEVSRIRNGNDVGVPDPPPTDLSDLIGNENPSGPPPF